MGGAGRSEGMGVLTGVRAWQWKRCSLILQAMCISNSLVPRLSPVCDVDA